MTAIAIDPGAGSNVTYSSYKALNIGVISQGQNSLQKAALAVNIVGTSAAGLTFTLRAIQRKKSSQSETRRPTDFLCTVTSVVGGTGIKCCTVARVTNSDGTTAPTEVDDLLDLLGADEDYEWCLGIPSALAANMTSATVYVFCTQVA